MGAALFELANTQFKGKLEAMLKVLLDDHPAGWSTIMGRQGAADFSKPVGYVDINRRDDYYSNRPKCYWHGDRHDEAWEVKSTDPETWCEWAYVINAEKHAMVVLEEVGRHGETEWRVAAVVDLDEPEPSWEAIDAGLMAEA
jgi:hypothetical protein